MIILAGLPAELINSLGQTAVVNGLAIERNGFVVRLKRLFGRPKIGIIIGQVIPGRWIFRVQFADFFALGNGSFIIVIFVKKIAVGQADADVIGVLREYKASSALRP